MTKLRAVAAAVLTTLAFACGSADDTADDFSTEDALASKQCGGIAGLACPSQATCVEDPTDSCDPATGGRDCIGICINATTAKTCGGLAGLSCNAGYACVDDPRDSCDPLKGGNDCGGLCARVRTTTRDAGSARDGDAVRADRRIDPIELGHAWTYDVEVLGWYPACSSGLHTATTVEAGFLHGKDARRVQSLCDKAGVFTYAVDGDRVLSWFAGAWRLSVDSPVQEGHTWSDDYSDYAWEKVGRVTVPAGTFDDCWSAKKLVRYSSYTVFCRGAGPVRWHYEDRWGNGYDAILTAKNF